MKLVSSVPVGEVIVSMVVHNDKVVVATDKYVYMMGSDETMRRVVFEAGSPKAMKGVKVYANELVDDVESLFVTLITSKEEVFNRAKLSICEADSEFTKLIYSDDDLCVALMNPVIADCNGVFPDIFISPSNGSYRVELKNNKDTPLINKVFCNE